MANQNTTQEQTGQSQHLITSTSFQILKDLPVPLSRSQCVLHKHEILICGGEGSQACYSYDTLKNEFKFICEYPSDIILRGHCVVKLVDNNSKDDNQITLLSFGGWDKHTLIMKYVSVWSNENNNSDNEKNRSNNYNKWVPFTDNHNNPITIGRIEDIYEGARAVIGGSNNHLLFITYPIDNISVFNLNTFRFIKYSTLLIQDFSIANHCF
ncbi:hypothetical protein RFI_02217, partial [Reticulomyxa filosa]